MLHGCIPLTLPRSDLFLPVLFWIHSILFFHLHLPFFCFLLADLPRSALPIPANLSCVLSPCEFQQGLKYNQITKKLQSQGRGADLEQTGCRSTSKGCNLCSVRTRRSPIKPPQRRNIPLFYSFSTQHIIKIKNTARAKIEHLERIWHFPSLFQSFCGIVALF